MSIELIISKYIQFVAVHYFLFSIDHLSKDVKDIQEFTHSELKRNRTGTEMTIEERKRKRERDIHRNKSKKK